MSILRKQLKQLGKDSVIYGLGGFLAKSVSFFLLPVYTRIFAPAEFGIIEMLIVINAFLGIALTLGMDSAQSFYFFEQKKLGVSTQSKVVSSVLQWRLLWGILVVGLSALLSPFLNHFFFSGKLTLELFAVAFCGAFLSQLMNQCAEVFRLLYRPWAYISITLGQALSSAAVTIILIVIFDKGIIGFFIGTLTGSLLAGVVGWWFLRSYLDWSGLHKHWWPRLLKFGIPLVPAGLCMYVMSTSDRWFILYFHNEEMLGRYAVGAKIAMLIGMAITTFRQAWWPVALEAMQSDDGPDLFRTIARLYLGAASAGVVALTAISPGLMSWITVPSYFGAYPIIGVLAWHSVFFGFYLICGAGIWKMEKTHWSPILMGGAAFLNIILDILFIPTHGGLGAAAATSISFLVWNIASLAVSEKLWPVKYDITILLGQVLIGTAATAGLLYIYNQDGSNDLAAFITVVSILFLVRSAAKKDHYLAVWNSLKRKGA